MRNTQHLSGFIFQAGIHSVAVSCFSNGSICRTDTVGEAAIKIGLIVFPAHFFFFFLNPGGSLAVSCQVQMNQNLINARKQQTR